MGVKATKKQRTGPDGGGVTYEQIAARAYEIHASGDGGDELANWLQAERELTGDAGLAASSDPEDESDWEPRPAEEPDPVEDPEAVGASA